MDGWSALWRVRGSLAVPVEADDGGLVSRIGDVFTRTGDDVAEERDDYLLFAAPKNLVPLPVRGAEFRREGIRGWRFIRYDLPVLHELPDLVLRGFAIGTLIGYALDWAGVPPYAYASTLVATAFLYWTNYLGTRRFAHDGLRRAFLT